MSKALRSSIATRMFFLPILLLLILCTAATAHDPGLSYAEFTLTGDSLQARLVYNYVDIQAVAQLDRNTDGQITADEVAAGRGVLEDLARSALDIFYDGERVLPAVVGVNVAKAEDGRDTAFLTLKYPGVPGARLMIRSNLLDKLADTHREYLKLVSGTGVTLAERLLTRSSPTAEIASGELAAGLGPLHTVTQFGRLGLEHILLGFDHLCFLLALLLVAGNISGLFKIVTSFTIAHSITLGLASMDKVSLSPSIVEPMIAVSIIYVGLENIWRRGREVDGRWMLTFGFGLIHGFGFATVLRDVNIGGASGSVVVPLVSFNLGVEVGQLLVVALAFPLIRLMRQKEPYRNRLVPGISLLVAIAGVYWLIQRTVAG